MDDSRNALLDKAVFVFTHIFSRAVRATEAPLLELLRPAAPPLASPLPCGSTILLQHRCVPLPANRARAQRWPTPTGPPPAARRRRPPPAVRRPPRAVHAAPAFYWPLHLLELFGEELFGFA